MMPAISASGTSASVGRQGAPVGPEGVRLARADEVVVVAVLHLTARHARALEYAARHVRRAVLARLGTHLP